MSLLYSFILQKAFLIYLPIYLTYNTEYSNISFRTETRSVTFANLKIYKINIVEEFCNKIK